MNTEFEYITVACVVAFFAIVGILPVAGFNIYLILFASVVAIPPLIGLYLYIIYKALDSLVGGSDDS